MATWTYDAPAGVYKNHAMSGRLRETAIAQTKFMQFVKPESGYGKGVGESLTITRVASIPVPSGSARLVENVKIPEDNITLSTSTITVSEWGRAVPFTELMKDLSKFDPENIIQKELMRQMTLELDRAAAGAFRGTQTMVKYIPTGIATGVFDTDGVPSTVALANLNVTHIEQIRDYMFSTLWIPPYEGDDYIGLVSTKAKRGLMNDPAWEQWHVYTNPEAKYNGEIGRIEGIRFIEINNPNALSNALGSGGVLGEAVIFGDDAIVMAVAQDPELRAMIPQDFGRQRAVAWYGILEYGVVWQTANPGEARVVHVTSA